MLSTFPGLAVENRWQVAGHDNWLDRIYNPVNFIPSDDTTAAVFFRLVDYYSTFDFEKFGIDALNGEILCKKYPDRRLWIRNGYHGTDSICNVTNGHILLNQLFSRFRINLESGKLP
ncbi:unnamed protein product, partial [Mesorhabditis spiculigera]